MIKADTDRKIFIAQALGILGDTHHKKFTGVFKTFTTKVKANLP
jgi:hypothetical protein